MKIFKLAAIFATAALIGGSVSAATVAYTEGQRDIVKDSIEIAPNDVRNAPPGFDLGPLVTKTDIHGRIVQQQDLYDFTTTRVFSVKWLFGGFDLEAGGSVGISGLVSVPAGGFGGPVDFILEDLMTNTVVATAAGFVADLTSGVENIFAASFGPGSYRLTVDGMALTNVDDALYDISITTVPLPAGFLLMGSALGGLVMVRRRKQKTA